MDLKQRVTLAVEAFQDWKDTHLADVEAELAKLQRIHQAAGPAAEEAAETPAEEPDSKPAKKS